MRLIDPGPGELLDRLTILNLKIEACQKKAITPQAFERERKKIEEILLKWSNELKSQVEVGEVAKLQDQLQAVNGQLWLAEDDVRATPELQAMKLARLAKWIPRLNDRRADVIAKINAKYGAETIEKLYANGVQAGMSGDLAE